MLAISPSVILRVTPERWNHGFAVEYGLMSSGEPRRQRTSKRHITFDGLAKYETIDFELRGADVQGADFSEFPVSISFYSGPELTFEDRELERAPCFDRTDEKIQTHLGVLCYWNDEKAKRVSFWGEINVPSELFTDLAERLQLSAALPNVIIIEAAESTLILEEDITTWDVSKTRYLFIVEFELGYPEIRSSQNSARA